MGIPGTGGPVSAFPDSDTFVTSNVLGTTGINNCYQPWNSYSYYPYPYYGPTLEQIREVVRDEIKKALSAPNTDQIKQQLKELADKL